MAMDLESISDNMYSKTPYASMACFEDVLHPLHKIKRKSQNMAHGISPCLGTWVPFVM